MLLPVNDVSILMRRVVFTTFREDLVFVLSFHSFCPHLSFFYNFVLVYDVRNTTIYGVSRESCWYMNPRCAFIEKVVLVYRSTEILQL